MWFSTSQSYEYAGTKSEFLQAIRAQLERDDYQDYLLRDQSHYLIFKKHPKKMRPFGNDTGFSAKVLIVEVEPRRTQITIQESYPLLLRVILSVFVLIGLLGGLFMGRYDWLILTLLLALFVLLLNRYYLRRMKEAFDGLMKRLQK